MTAMNADDSYYERDTNAYVCTKDADDKYWVMAKRNAHISNQVIGLIRT